MRAAMSAVRLCAAAAARQPAAHRSGRWHQLLRQPRAARQAAAVRRRYHVAAPGPYAIATPFPGAPALQEAAPKPWVRAVPAAAPGALQRRLGDLWQLYLQSLARRPLLTKAATSFVCVLIGDSIAQCIGGAPYSLVRVLRLAAYSSSVGAVTGHYWHRWLEQHVHPEAPRSRAAVAKKTLLDQLVLSPVMTAVFFTALKMMEGRPDAIVPFLQEKWLATVATSVCVWGPYNVMSFKCIPEQLRILCGNTAGILWGVYMSCSCVNQAPAAPAACPPASAAAAVAAALEAQGR